MRIAFVFPGQGSQAIGMGQEVAEAFSEARSVFQEVDEALEQNLSKIIFEGQIDELTKTANAQPALMAVSMAILAVLEAQGLRIEQKINYFAGHSLGEYSAYCGAKTFSLADTARLLSIRGQAMQQAVPVGIGSMAAIIGLEENIVEIISQEALCKGICQIANDNGGGQFVISGEKEAVEYATELAKEKGAKRAILLPVSAPFHCSMMQPAAFKMAEALDKVPLKKPIIPVISNIHVAPEPDIDSIKNSLVKQVTGRVRWRETIEWFGTNEVTKIYEIGAGKVLTGLTKRINKDIDVQNVSSIADIEATLKALDV